MTWLVFHLPSLSIPSLSRSPISSLCPSPLIYIEAPLPCFLTNTLHLCELKGHVPAIHNCPENTLPTVAANYMTRSLLIHHLFEQLQSLPVSYVASARIGRKRRDLRQGSRMKEEEAAGDGFIRLEKGRTTKEKAYARSEKKNRGRHRRPGPFEKIDPL
ncbi:hypothetical protein E2C01_062378 [Portunus trituberculatus]|uniref:Uncharacterized protein n=1 Tax=Portunus trituberculatus TaxID=210409 RepID=A0A5B7H6A0_PORTR|nr:hypothetical protein [Portunus trituberculatus]